MPSSINPLRLQEAIERQFECARCGHCCKGDGLVSVDERELDAMASYLNLSRQGFIEQYVAEEDGPGRWLLKDKYVEVGPGGHPEQWCIFLERDREGLYLCGVNPAKPRQCATFPANWRNPDSEETCVGLRALIRELSAEG